MCKPIPPAHFEIIAQSLRVAKIPSILSSFIANKKHDDNCGRLVAALNSVGVACVKYFLDIYSYVSIASFMSIP